MPLTQIAAVVGSLILAPPEAQVDGEPCHGTATFASEPARPWCLPQVGAVGSVNWPPRSLTPPEPTSSVPSLEAAATHENSSASHQNFRDFQVCRVTTSEGEDMTKHWLAAYGRKIPAEIDAHAHGSVLRMLEDAMQRFADKPAFRCFGQTLTYADSDRLS